MKRVCLAAIIVVIACSPIQANDTLNLGLAFVVPGSGHILNDEPATGIVFAYTNMLAVSFILDQHTRRGVQPELRGMLITWGIVRVIELWDVRRLNKRRR